MPSAIRLTEERQPTLADAIVETVREPMVVLNRELRVVAASRSFYQTFTVSPPDTKGKLFYELGGGDWDIPELRQLLGKILPERGAIENCEVEHDFRAIGRRTMRLNARHLVYARGARTNILLGIEDLTRERSRQRAQDEMLQQKDILLSEIQHRIGNSLQIIANIMLVKALSVTSEETRRALTDAHDRVISIAAVQHCLHAFAPGGSIELAGYLGELCEAMSQAVIRDRRSIAIEVIGDNARVSCTVAESLGLIVAELVINALKYAFDDTTSSGRIRVCYTANGDDWSLTVADNGVGQPESDAPVTAGLGTGIIRALAERLGARVSTMRKAGGTAIAITHAAAGGNEAAGA
ncbi:MAG: ATP-binding protein [Rhodopseudomonas sp.]|uniref:sensor histidine kinase n=1 Tax=Rhodopseudomonas sp. TaxID=1078 RepID=UPI0017E8D90F|nr:sensor histidine kinase [Rhodopseudomonas sp.]NVN88892.1 ATP-binding protein [Rhodopseudomonas sp.]